MTGDSAFDAAATRRTIEETLPEEVSAHGQAPEPRYLYVPFSHLQALSPDRSLVTGIRGAGKSVWWAALQSEEHRTVIGAAVPRVALKEVATVSAGFGEAPRIEDYPDKRTLKKLLGEGRAPEEIWRTVVAWHTWGPHQHGFGELLTWSDRARWLEGHPEEAARSFKAYDDEQAAAGRKQLVLFDALDRSADDWDGLRQLLKGLLEVLLEFRSYRALRAKAFVRPDMLDDPAVTAFPDASKVLAGRVDLRWPRADLYGLLFQYLGNASTAGGAFREGCEALGSGRWKQTAGIWQMPEILRESEALQRKIFHDIAFKWMGRDRRRGLPYTWLPNHLADARGQVSPRSFLRAIRTAAEASRSYHPWSHALHYEGIKVGVQEASRIRVKEVAEDFPWVQTLMEPLGGLVIPCQFEEIENRWKGAKVIEKLRRQAKQSGALPPKRIEEHLPGLRRDLLELALFSEQPDGRINMPDVYRVGFGLGRRGGVKPIR
jgi:hypothetical protein